MADAAVEFLLSNLQQLVTHHAGLISGATKEVKQLQIDLRFFQAFLREYSSKSRRKDDRLKELVRQIRDVVYEAEDVIDTFVTQANDIRTRNYFVRAIRTPISLHDIAGQVKNVTEQINNIFGTTSNAKLHLSTLSLGDGTPTEKQEAPVVRKKNVVGFEDEVAKISGYLLEQTQHLDVISVIGMPGLGKTTLAGMIYDHLSIQYEFPTRVWVYVSQTFKAKDVFIDILKQLITNPPSDMDKKTDLELAAIICDNLERGKYLIVMDDVWTSEDWDRLKIALPGSNIMGKVLITSRQAEVGRYANRNRDPHQLRFFTPDESWLLFRLEVFGQPPQCPSDLETLGKIITKECGGLPLAIVIIGGILAKKYSASTSMKNTWTKVANRVKEHLTEEDPAKRMENLIGLSYFKLPNHLRVCFLYLGMFAEDTEIPVWKLIRMWVAEGFIQQKDGITLEETAESYLEDLIDRNLIKIDKMRGNGKLKTCRIHDMLRDFCKTEGGKDRENFLQEIKMSSEGRFESLDTQSAVSSRRVCIHSNVPNFLSSKPYGPHVRSFVCFSKEDIALPPDNMSAIFTAFKLLRVLDVKPIKFTKNIPSEMYQLLHLKYIHLSVTLASLPKAFTKLLNIQTLIVDTTSRTLDIKAEIWKMAQLRHLQTNASTTLPKPSSSSSSTEGGMIQTLTTISPKSCTKEVFTRASNLKKLGIRGVLATLLDGTDGESFDSLFLLGSLEKLKLINDVFINPTAGNRLGRLPPADSFPLNLRILTIVNTYLGWTHMSTLGSLKCLEVLKLKDNAFAGNSWETEPGGFRKLEVLYIGRTDLAVWQASADHFPKLRSLLLRNCEQLQGIPVELADIKSLQLIDLFHATPAASSAKQIKKKRTEIKLSIFPANE